MMAGYIKLYKQIIENPVWSDKPFARGQAWIDLLLMANFADGEMFSKGTLIEVKRGQVFRTIKYLSERWGWSTKKTKKFLLYLEKSRMIALKGLPQGTLITIEKYSDFQSEGLPRDTSEDLTGYQPGTNQEPQNKKNKKNKKNNNIFCPPSVDEVKAYCFERNNKVDAETFVDFYSSKGWMVGKNKMKDWKAAVRNWERTEAGDSLRSASKSKIEPPKYPEFKPTPKVDKAPMPEAIRQTLKEIF